MEFKEPTISNKTETNTIPESEIPEWLKNKVKEMMAFAVNGGGEREDGVGSANGFYHVHLIVPKDVAFSGTFDSDWPQILPRITALLGHTQELATFDVSKRSIFYPLDKEPCFVHPPQEARSLNTLLKGIKVKYSIENLKKYGTDIVPANSNNNKLKPEILSYEEDVKRRHQAGTVLVPELEDGENFREVGYLYFYKQPDGNFSWFAKL